MSLFKFIENYTEKVGGQYNNYDSTRSVVVVPLNDGRYQTVLVSTEDSATSGKNLATFSSKITDFNDSINLLELLESSAAYDFSRFVVRNGDLKVEASCLSEAATEDSVKYILQEVASIADEYEKKITGKDIH